MKKLLITIMLLIAISLSFAQTITWKKLANLPEGFYSGEAVSLNNEIYFIAGRNDNSFTPFFYKFNPKINQWIKFADIPNPTINLAIAPSMEKYMQLVVQALINGKEDCSKKSSFINLNLTNG